MLFSTGFIESWCKRGPLGLGYFKIHKLLSPFDFLYLFDRIARLRIRARELFATLRFEFESERKLMQFVISPTHSLTHSLTHLLTHSLAHHSLTNSSLTHSFFVKRILLHYGFRRAPIVKLLVGAIKTCQWKVFIYSIVYAFFQFTELFLN